MRPDDLKLEIRLHRLYGVEPLSRFRIDLFQRLPSAMTKIPIPRVSELNEVWNGFLRRWSKPSNLRSRDELKHTATPKPLYNLRHQGGVIGLDFAKIN